MEFDVKLHWWNHITYLRFMVVPKNGSSFTEQVESISKPLSCLQNSVPAISPGQKWCQFFVLLTFPPLFFRENLKFRKKMAEMPAFPFVNTVIHIRKEIRLSKYPTPTMKNAEEFHKCTWLSMCTQTKIPTTIPYMKYCECSCCLRPCPNKDRHHNTRQCNEWAICSAPSKKVQCNSCKLIANIHHVNHTFSINGWATFKMYFASQNFLGGLVDRYDTH